MFLVLAIIVVIIAIWYFQFREESAPEVAAVTPVPVVSKSEVAAKVIATAEAPAGGVSSTSVSSGASDNSSMPAVAVVTATTPADTSSGISAIVKMGMISPPTSEVAAPIMPVTPVTAVLPTPPPATAATLAAKQPTYTTGN